MLSLIHWLIESPTSALVSNRSEGCEVLVHWNRSCRNIPSARLSFRLMILSIFLVQPGCTTALQDPWKPHLQEELRARISTIQVVVAEDLPRVTVDLPSKGALSGAGRKAGKWSSDWVMAAAQAGGQGREVGATIGAVMILVTPVVAATGAVYGAIEAPSAETVESQETQVRGVLQPGNLIQHLQNQIRMQVEDRTDISVALLPESAMDQRNWQGMPSASGRPPQDPILAIRLQSIDLRGSFDVDPPLALHVNAQVTLAAPSDSTPLYTHTFQYVTGARSLSEWTMNDAMVFHQAFESSLARLAELIVDDVLLTYPFAHEHPKASHAL